MFIVVSWCVIFILRLYALPLFKGFGVLAARVMLYIKQAGMALCLPRRFVL